MSESPYCWLSSHLNSQNPHYFSKFYRGTLYLQYYNFSKWCRTGKRWIVWPTEDRCEDHQWKYLFSLQQEDRYQCLCCLSKWQDNRTLCLLSRFTGYEGCGKKRYTTSETIIYKWMSAFRVIYLLPYWPTKYGRKQSYWGVHNNWFFVSYQFFACGRMTGHH